MRRKRQKRLKGGFTLVCMFCLFFFPVENVKMSTLFCFLLNSIMNIVLIAFHCNLYICVK